MNRLLATQLGNNAASREHWDGFRSHRERVMGLLGGAAGDGGRLCILGAGNCNDLDLAQVAALYREVHLVDLDAEALEYGIRQPGVADHVRIQRHGGVDLSGMLDTMAQWSRIVSIGDDDVLDCRRRPVEKAAALLPRPFDVVASVCVLSQIILSACQSLGNRHPRYPEVLIALRAGHVDLMLELLRRGGTGLFITDFVSSETLPGLAAMAEEDLPGLLPRLSETSNFFDGLNPFNLDVLFRTSPPLSPRIGAIQDYPPWRWRLGPRTYLVWALRFQRLQ